MSKTHRFDSEFSKPRTHAKCHRNHAELDLEMQAALEAHALGGAQMHGIDPAWAVERMRDRIDFAVRSLIIEGLALESEREDYMAKIVEQLVKAAPLYNPEFRNANGVHCSPLHYLRIVEARTTQAIRRYAAWRKRRFSQVAVVTSKEDAETEAASISSDDVQLSDRCKSVRQLEFVMTRAALYDSLTDLERSLLNARLAGFTNEEATARISRVFRRDFSPDHLRKVVLPRIQAKAVRCGFERPCSRHRAKV